VRDYPEGDIESVILTEDDEEWYLQAGIYMVESIENLFKGVRPGSEERYRIGDTLSLWEVKARQDLINGLLYQGPAN